MHWVFKGEHCSVPSRFFFDFIFLVITCVCSIQNYIHIFTKVNVLPLKNVDKKGVFLWLKHSILKGEHCIRHCRFLFRCYSASSYMRLFNSDEKAYFPWNDCFSHIKTLILRSNLLKVALSFQRVTLCCAGHSIINWIVFSWQLHVSVQFSSIGLFSLKWMFLPLENADR
jgi:hypothetical protein